MRFIQHYSSSKGNLYEIVAANGKRLLLDPGVPWQKLLKAIDFNLRDIEACLISHAHADHCKAVEEVMQAGIDCYASEGTWKAISPSYSYYIRKVHKLKPGWTIPVKMSFSFYPFELQHDAPEPFGFVIYERQTQEYLLFCPDTSFIREKFEFPFSIVAVECSFDGEELARLVEAGEINEALARRLLNSHTAKQTLLDYLKTKINLDKCREIHLLHLSGDKIDKGQTAKEIEQATFIETKVKGVNKGTT